MNIGYKVFWSSKAEKSLADNLSYLEENWGIKIANKFLKTINEYEQIIAKNSELYPISSKQKRYRHCVITKQVSIYYKVEKDRIKIYSLWDNRQNPDNLKF